MMKHEIPKLDNNGLRQFGLMMGGFLVLVFGLLLPWLRNIMYPVWPWVAGGVFLVWALVAPMTMNGVYRLWMKFAMILGNIINSVVLAVVYYFLLTPIGFIMHLSGKDPMRRHLNKGIRTYRIVSYKTEKERMERPF